MAGNMFGVGCRHLLIMLLALCAAAQAVGQGSDVQDATQLGARVGQLYDAGEYEQAMPLAKQVLALRQRTVGPEHVEVAAALGMLGRLQTALGAYEDAEASYQRAIAIQERAGRTEHQDTARLVLDLASLYRITSAYPKAEPLYQRGLQIYEKVLGENHTDTARALNGLANLYADIDKPAQAEALYRRALTIRERLFGPEHPETAKILNNLATLYTGAGEFTRAVPLLQRSLAARERALGLEHPELLSYLSNLAGAQLRLGAFVEAETGYQRQLTIAEKRLGPTHPATAAALNNLGILYWNTGLYARAEPLVRRAITIQEAQSGSEPLALTFSLNNLASLYYDTGRLPEAESLYRRALSIAEKRLGPENPTTAGFLGNLGAVYTAMGSYQRAEPLLLRALALKETAQRPDYPDVAVTLNALGNLYANTGALDSAQLAFERGIDILQKTHGPEHVFVGQNTAELALVHWARNQPQQALSLLERSLQILNRNFERLSVRGSQTRRQAYQGGLAPVTYRAVAFSVQVPSRAASELGLSSVLQYKGRALDAMTDSVGLLRRSITPADQGLLDKLADVTGQLSTLTYQGSATTESSRARFIELTARQEELESELAKRSSEFRTQRTPVTLANVRRAIPADAMLVEWIRYERFDPRQRQRLAQPRQSHYAAYLLGRSGDPRVIDLGPSEVIEQRVRDFRLALVNSRSTDVKQRAMALSQKIVAPLSSYLQGVEHLLMSPDGLLNLVPMAALTDEHGDYLLEKREISYLTSGRDLLRLASNVRPQAGAVIIADPDYGELQRALAQNNPPIQPQRSVDLDRGGLRFRRLAGTELEARDLQALLGVQNGKVLLQRAASEENLKQLHSPRILHVASHGFFLGDEQIGSAVASQLRFDVLPAFIGENPLLRAGIALAGANQRRSTSGEDGILTALEATQLDLRGTELVVLSACDSGVGEVRNGDGVYGLRRALSLAGAQTQVTSLWKVSDQATRTLVVDYYKRLLQGAGRSAALRDAQRAMMADPKLSHPYFWASLVAIGNWTPLQQSGRHP